MKNLNKFLIILISVAFVASGLFAQHSALPKPKDQVEKQVKPPKSVYVNQTSTGIAQQTTYEELLQMRQESELPVPAYEKKSNGGSDATDSFCMPTYTNGCQFGDGLYDFAVEQIQNLGSGCADLNGLGWSEYYNLGPAILIPGMIYNFSMSVGYSNQHVNIWIDFNDDDLLSADEMILYDYIVASTGVLYDVPVTIPANATPGPHAMRAMCVWITTFTDPCGSYSYGEAEDYSVIIGEAAYGNVEGYVTANTGGAPISGAAVSINNGMYSTTSAANGFYQFTDVLEGTWNISCTMTGYNPNSSSVVVTEGVTTTKNFAMTAPTMDITPAAIDVVVDPFGTATEYVTIDNNGDGLLGWNGSIEYLTKGNSGTNQVKGSLAYAVQVYPSPNSVVSFDTDTPGSFTTISSTTLDPFAGDFSITSNNLLYCITYSTSTLYSIDVLTGTETMIAPVTGVTGGHNISGMACDKSTGIMYVSSTNITASDIYTVDLTTGVLTMIGTTGIPGIIEIAIDGTGTMYAWDIVNDESFTVDKATAASTYLGSLGIDLNYAQGGNWDPTSDIIYLSGYSAMGQLMTLDKITGALTVIGDFPGGAEIDALAFPGAAENWLSIAPSNGSINAGGTFQMTVNFDALDIVAGTVKTANLNFTSNPAVGTYTIPVSMTVGSLQFGHVTGTITLGGALPYNIGDVTEVLVTAGPYSAFPDASGYYDITAYPGTYDVTATLYGYSTQTINGVVVTENGTISNQNMTMPCLYGIVTGTVTSVTTGLPIPNATVKLLGTDFQDMTGPDGVYEFVVEAGTYNVKVNVVGYASETVSATVVAESTITVNFDLEDLEGIIVVIDLDPTPNGQALADVIQGFFPGGLVEYTTSINGVPLTEEVQSVFLLVGIFSNNFVLTETEATVITTWMNAYSDRNLYMEGGDTWAYDVATSLHGYFNISGLSDGGADLSTIEGIGSYWTGNTWDYIGENNWIDHLDAIAPAINVLSNPAMGYNCAVAYDAGTYRTVGASFEITGMTGGPGFNIGVACVMAWFGYPVFTYGSIEGYVTELAGGAPIAGADITVGGIASGTTDANGYYFIDQVLTGTWNVSCTKVGYNPASASVTIVEDVTSTQSFQLTEPQFNVTPLVMNQTLEPNGTAQQTVNYSNTGNGPVDWTASLSILSDNDAAKDAKGSMAYAVQVYPSPNSVVSFDTDVPSSFTTISSTTLDPFAGDFGNSNNSLLYCITYTTSQFYSIDITNGTETLIGNATGVTGGHNVSGMACDKSTGIMYVSSTNITASDIYTVNLTTGALTLIGTTGIPGIIEIAIDGTGTMYAWDIVNDEAFTVNKATGASTLLGPLGVDLNYAQGGNWDPASDQIYLAAYSASGQLMTMDKTTGALTYIGDFPGGAEVDAMGFPGSFNAWVSIDQQSGTLNGGNSGSMTVSFDATDMIPGIYEAEIHFGTNPNVGSPVVDITLTVEGLIPATNLTLDHTCTDVELTWEMPAGGNADSWNIYRDGVLLGNSTDMEHTDAMVMPEVEYGYYVKAVYAGEESMPTVTQYITVPVPNNLEADGLEAIPNIPAENDVTLNWDAPNACVAPDGYNIYRDGDQINTSLVTALTYVDPSLPIGLYEYYVVAVYYFGESDPSDAVYTLITGIEDVDSDMFRIYPNPASGVVNIESSIVMTGIKVINNAGQVVMNKVVDVNQYKIDVSQYEKGVYYIKIETAEGDKLRKITVN